VVHAADSYALAVLENLVHWNTAGLPPTLQCIRAEIPGRIAQDVIERSRIAKLAPSDEAAFRKIGDEWYRKANSAVLWVPSVVSPFDNNVLLNQEHPDFSAVTIVETLPAPLDPRLIA
jgi:RES domain-containing protein